MIQKTKHKEVIKAWLDGTKVQYKSVSGELWHSLHGIDAIWAEENEYRIKPRLTPVGLSSMVGSVVDCEFSDVDFGLPGKNAVASLEGINHARVNPYAMHGSTWAHCRPRMDHWMVWDGSTILPRPVPIGFLVHWELRNGEVTSTPHRVQHREWSHSAERDAQIIAFKVVGLAPGYCYPWELYDE
jgi:hypothetical protein